MARRARLATRAAACGVTLALHLAWAPAAHAQVGRHVSYEARTLEGTPVRIGAREPATLVAVFATWCTSCRGEFRTLDSLRRSLAPRGVRVLALSVDEGDDARVRRWSDARRTRLLVAHDGSGTVGRTFGTVGVPESYLVDTLGTIRWRAVGDIGAELPGLTAAVARLR